MKKLISIALLTGAMTTISSLEAVKLSKSEFNKKMRELWSDHGVWTREYIVSAVAGNSDAAGAGLKRLMKNQEDIGGSIGSLYGVEAGKKLTALLKDHIKFAGELVGAAIKNDTRAGKSADQKLHKNAADISAFLSKANPHIKEADMKAMMDDHLRLVTDLAAGRIKKQYQKDVATFDSYRSQLNHMADYLTTAIIAQKRDSFR